MCWPESDQVNSHYKWDEPWVESLIDWFAVPDDFHAKAQPQHLREHNQIVFSRAADLEGLTKSNHFPIQTIMNLEPIVNSTKQKLRSSFFNRANRIPRSWKPNEETVEALNLQVTDKLMNVDSIDSLNQVVVTVASSLSATSCKQGRPSRQRCSDQLQELIAKRDQTKDKSDRGKLSIEVHKLREHSKK